MGRTKVSIIIIGGGLSGLTCAILLNRYGFDVTLIEKKVYPFHRVCGEYVSNEVIPFLHALEINVNDLNPSHISRLTISSTSGKTFSTPLDLGGFGVSRFTFDYFLYKKAEAEGVKFMLNRKVNNISFEDDYFHVSLADNTIISSKLVIGCYGKRSNLDQRLNRSFFYNRSPYVGVKYHIKTDFPEDLIQLDNFEGGYCGTVKIEDDRYCLCYLTESRNLKKYGSLEAMEEESLFKNPFLKNLFKNSTFLFRKPEVINEISFERKTLVEDHILFCGDAAGMITPLCGNGMAMAVHSAKVLSDTIKQYGNRIDSINRNLLEQNYISNWHRLFSTRLKTGRIIQRMFGNSSVSNLAVTILKITPTVSKFIIGLTHGKPFL